MNKIVQAFHYCPTKGSTPKLLNTTTMLIKQLQLYQKMQRGRYYLHNFKYNWVQKRTIMLLEPRSVLEQFKTLNPEYYNDDHISWILQRWSYIQNTTTMSNILKTTTMIIYPEYYNEYQRKEAAIICTISNTNQIEYKRELLCCWNQETHWNNLKFLRSFRLNKKSVPCN